MVVGRNMCNRILSLCEHGYLYNIENGPDDSDVRFNTVLYEATAKTQTDKRGFKCGLSRYLNFFCFRCSSSCAAAVFFQFLMITGSIQLCRPGGEAFGYFQAAGERKNIFYAAVLLPCRQAFSLDESLSSYYFCKHEYGFMCIHFMQASESLLWSFAQTQLVPVKRSLPGLYFLYLSGHFEDHFGSLTVHSSPLCLCLF